MKQFKESLKAIGCHFVHSPTITGHNILIYSDNGVTRFEFDNEGEFLRTIIE